MFVLQTSWTSVFKFAELEIRGLFQRPCLGFTCKKHWLPLWEKADINEYQARVPILSRGIFCTWRIKMHSSIKRKRKCDEVYCYFVCVCVCPRLWCQLLVVHMLCVNSGCLDPWMQLQLFFVFLCVFFFAIMVIYFITACTLTKEKSPKLPLISCSIAPLGQNAWANTIYKGYQGNLTPPPPLKLDLRPSRFCSIARVCLLEDSVLGTQLSWSVFPGAGKNHRKAAL